jgi:hypothetical protein
MFMANRRSPLLHGRHGGLPLLHGKHKGLPLPFAIRHSLPFFQSPVANHRSLPFSVVADSLMADTRVCPYHSLIATRYSLPFSSRQSLITSRQSLPFSPVAAVLAIRYSPFAIRYSPLTTPAISSPLSGYN